MRILLLLLLLELRRLRSHAFTPASHTSGPTDRRLPLEPLQHLGPQEVETKPELLCFNAPRCLRSITYGHLFICACVAVSIHLLPPMLEGLLYLPSPALEEAPSVDEKVADLIHVAWCEVGCGCLTGGLEGQAARRRVLGGVVEDRAVERRVLDKSCFL